MKDLELYKIICDFCSNKTNFTNSKQVTLKIDKTNSYQNLFATICKACEEKGNKKTIHGQTVKVITNRNKLKNEESVFDLIEGETIQ